MSERVKELAKQAGWYDDKEFASWNKIYQWQHFDKEKFAELIVRECADLVDHAISDGGVDGRVVKEHFGVEE